MKGDWVNNICTTLYYMPTTFACFDVETTGLSSKNGRVIEIAIVKITDRGEVIEEWTSLVDAGTSDLGRSDIHGIRHYMLDGAPTFSEIAGDLISKFSGCIPVAHNANFDKSFMLSEWKRSELGALQFEVLDTLSMARKLDRPGKLGDLAEYYGVSLVDAHQALDDTRALAQVLIRLLEDGAEIGESHQFQPPLFAPEPSGRFHLRPEVNIEINPIPPVPPKHREEPKRRTKSVQEITAVSPWARLGALCLESLLLIVTFGVGWTVWALTLSGKGQTPAKKLLNHTVVDINTNQPLGLARMFWLRGILGGLVANIAIPLTFGILALMPFWDSKKQNIWDKVSGSHVIPT